MSTPIKEPFPSPIKVFSGSSSHAQGLLGALLRRFKGLSKTACIVTWGISQGIKRREA
jgi:hypothetical protein